MALSPVLIIGCGGSGGKVILSLRRRIEEDLMRRGWSGGIPQAFQFKWIDVPTPQEQHPEFGPDIALADYVPLATVDDYRSYDATLVMQAGPQRLERLVGWRPSPDLELPVKDGAGQMRAIGRSVALSNPTAVTGMIRHAVQSMTTGQADLDVMAKALYSDGSANDKPLVVVVSSMAGGTGAGVFLDVCDLVRGAAPELSERIVAVLFTAEIFREVKVDSGMTPNTLASAAELMNSSLSIQRRAEVMYNLSNSVAVAAGSGPAATYVVGLQTMTDNRSLESPAQCYRAVTESLLTMMLDPTLQRDILAYDTANRIPNQSARGSAYTMISNSPGNGVPMRTGFVSSFGSAKVSVGSARFSEWARDRLARDVITYVQKGWRARGLELLEPTKRDTATDQEIVDFLVARDREVFIDRCGLREENEPDGTRHDQVLDGIITQNDLGQVVKEFRNQIIGHLQAAGQKSGSEWPALIVDQVKLRNARFQGDVAKALTEGGATFAEQVVPRLRTAVSEWLARYGLPVTLGLVKELKSQCQVAEKQVRDEAVRLAQQANVDPLQSVIAAFQPLGKSQCSAGQEFVHTALRHAVGPLWTRALQGRCESAGALLIDLIDRVLNPLLAELEQVGLDLQHPSFIKQVEAWPNSSGVAAVYAPPPSEFCLEAEGRWGAKYEELLKASAGSVIEARDLVAAGGFEYGKPGARKTAESALHLEADGGTWLGRDGRPVHVHIALGPNAVVDRVRLWIEDDSHPLGRFVHTGLAQYLKREDDGRPISDHLDRLDRFRVALAGAKQLASPLFRVNPTVMSRFHPGKSHLETVLTAAEFPFDPDHPARSIVQEVLYDENQRDKEWCSNSTSAPVESVLLVSRLSNPVHPGAVASLYQPIAQRWNNILHSPNPNQGVAAFWKCNRARVLDEFIPLPRPSTEQIVAGWFIGRLLGMVSDPLNNQGSQVWTVDSFGQPVVAQLPWPLLRHGEQPNLHRHRQEWLPAILEHTILSMMLVSQDEHALDGHQRLFDIGEQVDDLIQGFIVNGTIPARTNPQVRGSSAEERKADFIAALDEAALPYKAALQDTKPKLVADYSTFRTIPYGFELFPMFVEELGKLKMYVESTTIGVGGRG